MGKIIKETLIENGFLENDSLHKLLVEIVMKWSINEFAKQFTVYDDAVTMEKRKEKFLSENKL